MAVTRPARTPRSCITSNDMARVWDRARAARYWPIVTPASARGSYPRRPRGPARWDQGRQPFNLLSRGSWRLPPIGRTRGRGRLSESSGSRAREQQQAGDRRNPRASSGGVVR
jgi:hypothetical protein